MVNPFRKERGRIVSFCKEVVKHEILNRVENLRADTNVDGRIAVIEGKNCFIVLPETDEIEYRLEEYGNSKTAPRRLWKKHLSD